MNVLADPLFWYDPMQPFAGYWTRLYDDSVQLRERQLECLLCCVKLLNIKEEIEDWAA